MEPNLIYDRFKNRTESLINIIAENVSRYPEPLDELGLNYLRIKDILPGKSIIKGIQPNSLFWLETEFDVESKVVDTLWLGLLYLLLSYTARDDLIDNDKNPNLDLLALSNLFMADFINLHTTIFPKNSKFWNVYSNSTAECYRAEVWERTSDISDITDFSEDFLLKLTKKHTGISIPSLSALPLLNDREDMVEPLVKMIKHYYVAHKLLDDLDDWEIDLKDRNFNFSSTILFYMLRYKKNTEQIKCDEIRLSMINSDFIETILEIALNYLVRSLDCLKEINSPCLKIFLEGRIESLRERIKSTSKRRCEALDLIDHIEYSFYKEELGNEGSTN